MIKLAPGNLDSYKTKTPQACRYPHHAFKAKAITLLPGEYPVLSAKAEIVIDNYRVKLLTIARMTFCVPHNGYQKRDHRREKSKHTILNYCAPYPYLEDKYWRNSTRCR